MTDVAPAPFGTTPAGEPVETFTLRNANRLEMRVATYGGIIVSLSVPDRDGRMANVVLGHDTLEQYIGDSSYLGAIVGRCANRIAHARFTVDGKTYQLAANAGPNHLHGGRTGLDRVVWRASSIHRPNAVGVVLGYTSPDGEEGYPGNLDIRVSYLLTDRNELVVDYAATTDRATPVNLTQHSYFNLAGAGDVLGHLLWINADHMTLVDEHYIPTGEIAPVAGSPFDFRSSTRIGARIASDDEQLRRSRGYDLNFVLNRGEAELIHAARVEEPTSGRTLDLHTTEPGLQLYSANHLDHAGLCLETQHFPDSPNQPAFPTTLLRPGAQYRSQTVFTFGVIS